MDLEESPIAFLAYQIVRKISDFLQSFNGALVFVYINIGDKTYTFRFGFAAVIPEIPSRMGP